MPHAEMPHRVYHRIDDRCRRTDCRRFADALRAERMMRRRRDRVCGLPLRCFDCCRQQIVHETTLQDVTAFIVLNLLVERRAESHRETAMNLTLDDHWVDDVAAIVDGHE